MVGEGVRAKVSADGSANRTQPDFARGGFVCLDRSLPILSNLAHEKLDGDVEVVKARYVGTEVLADILY